MTARISRKFNTFSNNCIRKNGTSYQSLTLIRLINPIFTFRGSQIQTKRVPPPLWTETHVATNRSKLFSNLTRSYPGMFLK